MSLSLLTAWFVDHKDTLLSASAAALGAVAGFANFAVNRRFKTRTAKRMAEGERSIAIIKTGDLDTIGHYLKRELGAVEAAAYAGDDEVRRRVNASIAKIAAIVALDQSETHSEPVSKSGAALPPEVPIPSGLVRNSDVISGAKIHPADVEAVKDALREIDVGKYWNALFGIRRDLELKLRGTPFSRGEVIRPTMRFRTEEGKVAYKIFLHIANPAIHGAAVSDDELDTAIDAARIVYASMENIMPPESSDPLPAENA